MPHPKHPGRPKSLPNAKNRCVYLDDNTWAKAIEVGQGNASQGIRSALLQYSAPEPQPEPEPADLTPDASTPSAPTVPRTPTPREYPPADPKYDPRMPPYRPRATPGDE